MNAGEDTGVDLFGIAFLVSGLLLVLLLPIGVYVGVGGGIYDSFSVLHLCIVFGLALLSIYRLVLFSLKVEERLIRYGALLSIFCGLIVVPLCFLPVVSRDALIHHLAVPKWWLESGAILPIPWHEWSYYPMLNNLVYVFLLKHGLEPLCSLYHFLYLIILALGVFEICRSLKLGIPFVAIAVSFVFLLPINLNLASAPLVDLALAAYLTFSLNELIKVGKSSEVNYGTLLTSGIFLGFGLSTKYNSLLALVCYFLSFLVFFEALKVGRSRAVKLALFVMIPALIVASPWFVKNYLWTGNPIYPLYRSTFGGGEEWKVYKLATVKPLLRRMYLYGESPLETLLLPFRIFMEGQDGDPRTFDGVLSPFLLLAILPLLLLFSKAKVKALGVYTYLYFFLMFLTASARVRYLAPVFGTGIALFSQGLEALFARFVRNKRLQIWLLATVLGAQLLMSYSYLFRLYKDRNFLDSLNFSYSRASYLRSKMPEYGLIEATNTAVKSPKKVMLVYTSNPFYYFEAPVFSWGYYSGDWLVKIVREAHNVEDVLESFEDLQIGFLFVNTEKFREVFYHNLTLEQRLLWNEFTNEHLAILNQAGAFSLWQIR